MRQSQKKNQKARQRERKIQIAAFDFIYMHEKLLPELKRVYHVANQQAAGAVYGANLKRMGKRAGIWDIAIDLGRHGYHGMRIETKAPGGSLSIEQRDRGRLYQEDGYAMAVCETWDWIVSSVVWYIFMDTKEPPPPQEAFDLVQKLCKERLDAAK